MSTFRGLLILMRPPNLPTAVADILAGATIAGYFTGTSDWAQLFYLAGGSVCLYAGGVVLNDVFDLDIDRKERPERPIPSGAVPARLAAAMGGGLLIFGTLLAFLAGSTSGTIALILAILILLYDAVTKKYDFLGPLNMGLCRGVNLLLGMSVFGHLVFPWLAFIPLLYIFAITLVSRGEVHGNNRSQIAWAGSTYALVITFLLLSGGVSGDYPLHLLPYVLLLAILIFRPLVKACKNNTPGNIRGAVKAGVMSLVVLDACLATAFGDWWTGILILCLWPISLLLAKLFAVT